MNALVGWTGALLGTCRLAWATAVLRLLLRLGLWLLPLLRNLLLALLLDLPLTLLFLLLLLKLPLALLLDLTLPLLLLLLL